VVAAASLWGPLWGASATTAEQAALTASSASKHTTMKAACGGLHSAGATAASAAEGAAPGLLDGGGSSSERVARSDDPLLELSSGLMLAASRRDMRSTAPASELRRRPNVCTDSCAVASSLDAGAAAAPEAFSSPVAR